MFALLQGTVRTSEVASPITVGIRVSGRSGGDSELTVTNQGMTYQPAQIDSLPAVLEYDAGSFVLRAFGRSNAGTIRGDMTVAEQFLNSFFAI
jgi:hypothetical protein